MYSVCTLYGVSLKFSFRIRIGKTDDVNMSLKRFLSLFVIGRRKKTKKSRERVRDFRSELDILLLSHNSENIITVVFIVIIIA